MQLLSQIYSTECRIYWEKVVADNIWLKQCGQNFQLIFAETRGLPLQAKLADLQALFDASEKACMIRNKPKRKSKNRF